MKKSGQSCTFELVPPQLAMLSYYNCNGKEWVYVDFKQVECEPYEKKILFN